jgi:hypothetical protein
MYENRILRGEARSMDEVYRDLERQYLAQQKRNKQATIRPATTVRPVPRPAQSWAAISAQLGVKRKHLQLVAA